jgi:hypothetical protein
VSDSEKDSDSDMSDYDDSSDEEHEDEDEDEEDDDGQGGVRRAKYREERKERELLDFKRSTIARAAAPKVKEKSAKNLRFDCKVTFDDMNASDDEETGANGKMAGWSLKDVMEQMDQELSLTCLSKSFEHKRKAPLVNPNQLEVFDDTDEEDSIRANASGSVRDSEDLCEIDVDLNAAKNILESFKSQSGLAGPSSNLLSSMGLHLPKDSD